MAYGLKLILHGSSKFGDFLLLLDSELRFVGIVGLFQVFRAAAQDFLPREAGLLGDLHAPAAFTQWLCVNAKRSKNSWIWGGTVNILIVRLIKRERESQLEFIFIILLLFLFWVLLFLSLIVSLSALVAVHRNWQPI